MYCPRCGLPVSDNANFCGGCGLPRAEILKYSRNNSSDNNRQKAEENNNVSTEDKSNEDSFDKSAEHGTHHRIIIQVITAQVKTIIPPAHIQIIIRITIPVSPAMIITPAAMKKQNLPTR